MTEFQKNLSGSGGQTNEEPYPSAESHNNSLLEPVAPPFPFPKLTPYTLGQVKSPFPRPQNPHLLSTPNMEIRPPSQQAYGTTVPTGMYYSLVLIILFELRSFRI